MHQFNLISQNKEKLILFFCGWGMDYTPFFGLESKDYDVVVFYKYTKIETDFNFADLFLKYKEINLISWSMGVWYSSLVMGGLINKLNYKIAINGTLKPIDDNFGINTKVYEATIQNFSKIGRAKFFKRMWNNIEIPKRFLSESTIREIEEQKEELIFLQKNIQTLQEPKNIFDKVIIASNDLICPTQNQINYWNTKTQYKTLNTSHFAFYLWQFWDEIIEYAITD